MRTRVLVIAALLFAVLHAAAAHADPTTAEVERAKQFYKEAVELRAAERIPEAIAKVEQALAIKETAGLRYHLATYQRDSGLLVEALTNYQRARDLANAGAKQDDVAELVGPALQEVEKRIATMELALDASRPVAAVEVDGKAVDTGAPVPLNPGNHQLSVRATDGTPFAQAFSLKEGERLRIAVKWPAPAATVPASPPPAPAQPTPASDPSRSLVPVYVGASLAAVALGAGVFFTLSASSNKDDARQIASQIQGNSACVPPAKDLRCGALEDAWDSYHRERNISYVAYGVAGAAAVGTAVYLFWPSPKSSNQSGWSARPFVAAGSDHWTLFASGSF